MADVSVVSGDSSGLGKEIAERLLSLDYNVVGVSRRKINAEHDHYKHVVGDISQPSTIESAVKEAAAIGRISLVVNCAGVGIFGGLGEYTSDEIMSVVGSNMLGTLLLSNEIVRHWKQQQETGTIVNVLSTAAFTPRANEAVYCAAKAAIKMFSEAARLNLKGSGISVINIFPGGMNTPFWKNVAGSDPSKFMSAGVVADIVLDAIAQKPGAVVTDVTINRPS